MNFTKLYYPTAEAAADDPDFLKKILADDTISIDLTVQLEGGPTDIIITLLNQILFDGTIDKEFSLVQTISPTDWLWTTGELSIKLIAGDNKSKIKLTKCKLQEIDMLIYPLSELVVVKQNDLQWIDTCVESVGSLSLMLSNPICMQVEHIFKTNYTHPVDEIRGYLTAEKDNATIKKYLKKLRI